MKNGTPNWVPFLLQCYSNIIRLMSLIRSLLENLPYHYRSYFCDAYRYGARC
jgi:hypothetical protein